MKLQSALIVLMLLILLPVAGCLPDEAMGQVTNVVDGDTFDIQVQAHDSRITDGGYSRYDPGDGNRTWIILPDADKRSGYKPVH